MNSTQTKVLKEENRRLREALGTIVHEINEALEHFVEENTFTEIRAIAQEALGWEESQMENKATNEELLRQQLERLSEVSAHAKSVEELVAITLAMTEVYKALSNNQMIQVTPLIAGEAID